MGSHLGPNPQNSLGHAHPDFHGLGRRNFQGAGRRSFQAPTARRVEVGVEKLSVKYVTDAVTDTLAPFEAKDIQEATGGSIRAAENAKQGLNAMSLTNFINACRAIPELRAVAMELMRCDGNTDPEFHRALYHLMNAHSRMGQADA